MPNKKKNVEAAVETVAQPANEQVVEQQNAEQTKVLSHEDAIAAFIAAGAELREDLHIERCAVSILTNADDKEHTILTITVKENIRRILRNNDTNAFEEREVHHFVISMISLLKVLSKNEVFSPFTRKLQQQPKLLEMLMPGSKISVLAINVEAGVEYTNFFTGDKSVPDNTSIYYEPTAIVAGQFATKQLAQAAQAVIMQALLS